MASLNRVFLLGNLGRDPEVTVTSTGQTVARFTVATNDVWTDAQGVRQERVEWHRVVVWGKQAENCKEYLRKGRTVFIEGRIQTRVWEDKQGQQQKTMEIVALRVQFIGGAKAGTAETAVAEPIEKDLEPPPIISDDDIPF